MNARIQELAEQCYQIEDPHGRFPREVLNPEKFAKLIIEECVDYAFANGDNVDYLKQYFGVEE
jgi:hypothetical protein